MIKLLRKCLVWSCHCMSLFVFLCVHFTSLNFLAHNYPSCLCQRRPIWALSPLESFYHRASGYLEQGEDAIMQLSVSSLRRYHAVISIIFNLSLLLSVVPTCFKRAAMSHPVTSPQEIISDYRPGALTSVVMKCLERLVKDHITSSLSSALDPLQFAYRPNRSTDDAIALALNTALSHLDQKNP